MQSGPPPAGVGSGTGTGAWRSLAERNGLAAWQRGEFAPGADMAPDALTRRAFLSRAAASLALAGLSGCIAKPAQQIVPYVRQPPELVPGVAQFYASSLVRDGYASGILVETHEGRPTKIEGNPDHPASLGSSGVLEQAAILDLYDPARDGSIRSAAQPVSWREARQALAQAAGGDGAGLHLLLEPSSSPSLALHLAEVRERLPRAVVHWHTTAGHGAELDATQRLMNQPLLAHPDLTHVQVGVALGGDPLATDRDSVRQARAWAHSRRDALHPSRWYVLEASPSCTGFSADHRIIVDDRFLPLVAAALLAKLIASVPGVPAELHQALAHLPPAPIPAAHLELIADDLRRAGPHALVTVGAHAPMALQALAVALNAALGSEQIGYRPSVLLGGERDGLPELVRLLHAGAVKQLVVVGANPLFTSPGDLDTAVAFRAAGQRFRVGLRADETAAACDWFIPLAHDLESWGDARSVDGTITWQQPTIDPLFAGRTLAEILDALMARDERPGHLLLRERWRSRGMGDAEYRAAIQRGCLVGSATPLLRPAVDWREAAQLVRELSEGGTFAAAPAATGSWDLSLYRDGKIHDGRYGDNPWLQELPDAITKLTWDNALLIAPALADTLGVRTGQLVAVDSGATTLRVPVLVQPGQSPGTVSLALGYGRRVSRGAAHEVGVDAYALRTSAQPWLVRGVRLTVLAEHRDLALTQEHWAMEERPVALSVARDQPLPPAIADQAHAPLSLRPDQGPLSSPQWGMVVDLGSCTGCNACVTACQAENNIPVVGREEVLRSREMHWLRVDRYYRGSCAAPEAISQPMMCQHCEKAPCEYVCPTYATTHSPDGLNEMTYNRCVGTRFCSNNCPYKVRRFNWFNYHQSSTPLTRMAMNPDVTVRARGVMEKCTYCVQRIRAGDISSRIAGQAPGTQPVVTACQQACPSQAIVFGNILDASSAVARARASPRAYAVLADSGAQPRTRYLARITNPNPAWA